MTSAPTASDIIATACASFRAARRADEPFVHYFAEGVLPPDVAEALAALSFVPPDLDGVSGARELHNESRSYFDAAHMNRFPAMRAVAAALQSNAVAATIAEAFDAAVDDTFLRIEYALDVDGFWLEPHTDLGVKKFTCLIYLSDHPGHATLGTDLYAAPDDYWGRSAFVPNTAMIFVPNERSWHGFEKRPIVGVRRSIVVNYVARDWMAREQLSFPDAPVRTRA